MKYQPRPFHPVQVPRVPPISVAFFVVGALCLDLNLPRFGGIKTGNIAMLVLFAFSFLLLVYANNGRIQTPRIKSSNLLLLFYLCLVGVSAAWSPSFTNTLFQFLLLSAIFFMSILLAQTSVELVVRYVFILAAASAALSLLMIYADQSIAFQPVSSIERPELRGIFEHQLRLGLFMGLALGLLALVILNGDFRRVFPHGAWAHFALPMILLAFYLAYARLYSVFIIAALLLTVAFSNGRIVRRMAIAGSTVIVASAIFFFGEIESGLSNAGIDTGLNGRTLLWHRSLEEAERGPFWGYGFGSFDSPAFDHLWPGSYRPPHPHNSFIQAFFETGYIGLILVLAIVLSHASVAARREYGRKYSYTFFMVVCTILGSLTGANYAAKPATLWCLVALMVSIAVRLQSSTQKQ